MSKTIYISRRCEHCHELLITLHKNKDIFKFPVVDIDTKAYPTTVNSVPCMVMGNRVLPGKELFKYLELLINENGKDKVEPHINQNLPGEPTQNMNSNNKQLPNSDLEGGPLESMDGPGGFCFGGMCDLSYSPLEEGDTINQDNYEYLDNSQNNEAGSKNKMQNDTRKEKSAQMDTDYERMMESRKMQQPEIRPR